MLHSFKKFKKAINKILGKTDSRLSQQEEQGAAVAQRTETVETTLNTNRLDSLMNIDKAIKQSRLMTLCCFAFTIIFCTLVTLFAFNYISKSRGQVFFTNGYGNTLVGYQIEKNQNVIAEVKSHVRNFHTFLYNITNDKSEVKKNLDLALALGDGSVKAFVDQRGADYYTKIIKNKIEIKYQCDSLKVNPKIYPYKAVAFGKKYIQNNVGILSRRLVTSCKLTEVVRTEKNPHGLLISNFEILKDERIE